MEKPRNRPWWARAPVVATFLLVGVAIVLEGVCRLLPQATPPDLAALAFGQAAERDLYEYDADLFWRLKPGLDLVYSGNRVRTNSLGLRGPEPRAPEVLCIGDSVAFGFMVEEEQSWPRLLEQATGLEVLVGAVPGYSSHQGRKLLERLLERYAPKYVILSFGYNDARLFPFTDREAAQGARARAGSLLRRSALLTRLAGWAGPGRRAAQARELLELRTRNLASFPPRDAASAATFRAGEDAIRRLLRGAPERVPLADYADNLQAMIDLCKSRGAKPILLATPYARRSVEPYFAASYHRTPVATYRERMHELSREGGASYASVPLLAEDASDIVTKLFVTRPLSDAEQQGFQLLGYDATRLFDMGLTVDFRRRTDLAHPSPRGHAMLAEALEMLVRK